MKVSKPGVIFLLFAVTISFSNAQVLADVISGGDSGGADGTIPYTGSGDTAWTPPPVDGPSEGPDQSPTETEVDIETAAVPSAECGTEFTNCTVTVINRYKIEVDIMTGVETEQFVGKVKEVYKGSFVLNDHIHQASGDKGKVTSTYDKTFHFDPNTNGLLIDVSGQAVATFEINIPKVINVETGEETGEYHLRTTSATITFGLDPSTGSETSWLSQKTMDLKYRTMAPAQHLSSYFETEEENWIWQQSWRDAEEKNTLSSPAVHNEFGMDLEYLYSFEDMHGMAGTIVHSHEGIGSSGGKVYGEISWDLTIGGLDEYKVDERDEQSKEETLDGTTSKFWTEFVQIVGLTFGVKGTIITEKNVEDDRIYNVTQEVLGKLLENQNDKLRVWTYDDNGNPSTLEKSTKERAYVYHKDGDGKKLYRYLAFKRESLSKRLYTGRPLGQELRTQYYVLFQYFHTGTLKNVKIFHRERVGTSATAIRLIDLVGARATEDGVWTWNTQTHIDPSADPQPPSTDVEDLIAAFLSHLGGFTYSLKFDRIFDPSWFDTPYPWKSM